MPTYCISEQLEFEGFDGHKVVAAFDGGAITSGAGALILRQVDATIGPTGRVAACFRDYRHADYTVRSLRTLVGQRIAAIALGYEDVDDHDTLRHDPVLGLVSESLTPKRNDCVVLAGKPTPNRLEHGRVGEPTRYHKKPRSTITPCRTSRPWPHNLNQTASGKPRRGSGSQRTQSCI